MTLMGSFLRVAAFTADVTTALTSCSTSNASDNAVAGSPILSARQTDIPGDLLPENRMSWQYEKTAGRCLEADEGAAAYTPGLIAPDGEVTPAWIDPWASHLFAMFIREGGEKYPKDIGCTLIYCNPEPRQDKPVSCAETLAGRQPDFGIARNRQGGASAATRGGIEAAKIPTNSINLVQPYSIFCEADSYTLGEISGSTAGKNAKQTWSCTYVWLKLGGARTKETS